MSVGFHGAANAKGVLTNRILTVASKRIQQSRACACADREAARGASGVGGRDTRRTRRGEESSCSGGCLCGVRVGVCFFFVLLLGTDYSRAAKGAKQRARERVKGACERECVSEGRNSGLGGVPVLI
jgi:hypothetical protein